MTTTLRVQAAITNDSGLPRDLAINTWHFISDNVDPLVDAALAYAQLTTFYSSIQGLLSPEVTGLITFKVYDLTHVQPRSPIYTNTSTVTPSVTVGNPNEVAVCLSYRGALVSGTNPARRRGRIFLGPVTTAANTAATGDVFVLGSFRTTIANAATALIAAGVGAPPSWAVFSPTTAGPEPWSPAALIGASLPVTAGFIDDAFDTIRSRGLAAQARTTF